MTASNPIGAVSSIVGAIWIGSVPVFTYPAFAYHGTADHTGAPVAAILPIVVVVVIAVIALSIWKPRSRKAGTRKRERAPGNRALHKKQKRVR